jgi:hypothetical protein
MINEAGAMMCRALGFDPLDVFSVTIYWSAGEMPYAEVCVRLNEHAMLEILKLRPVDDG